MQKIHTFLIQQDFLYLRSGEIEWHIRSSRQIIADIQKIPIAIIIYFEILMGLQKAIGVGDAVRYRTQYFIERDPTVVKIFIIDDIMKAIFFDILYRTRDLYYDTTFSGF